ncbi:MAG: 4-hydroxy-tetrahydrodipicolinate reductase [Oscillospiraceae bacterium]
MVDILLHGAGGKMGRVVAALCKKQPDMRIVAGVDPVPFASDDFTVYTTVDEVQEKADVMIDFSRPEATMTALSYCVKQNLPIVVCTTGLSDGDMQQLEKSAQSIPVFHSANMSVGINLLIELAKKARDILPGFDIEIIEAHHNEKVDAPSGTALMLANALKEQHDYTLVYDRHAVRQPRQPQEIGMHSIRGGTIVGEHEVLLAGPSEIIRLSHSAQSRDVFASGAVRAAAFLQGKTPSIYTMQDMIMAQ